MNPTEIAVGLTYTGCTPPLRTVLAIMDSDAVPSGKRVVYRAHWPNEESGRRKRNCCLLIFASWAETTAEPPAEAA